LSPQWQYELVVVFLGVVTRSRGSVGPQGGSYTLVHLNGASFSLPAAVAIVRVTDTHDTHVRRDYVLKMKHVQKQSSPQYLFGNQIENYLND
jgi:hypothetical protein